MKTILPRGCGLPQLNKIYSVVDVKDGKIAGVPVWAFAVCPTVPLTDDFALSRQGMELRPRMQSVLDAATMEFSVIPSRNREGAVIYDMYDWVGENNYPNPTDWLEEVMKLGFHQLVQKTLEFKLLTPESNYYAVHARANVVDPKRYWEERLNGTSRTCPKDIPEHVMITQSIMGETCHRVLYEDLVQGDLIGNDSPAVMRRMPAFEYFGAQELPDMEHKPAVFFKLPIGRLAYWQIYESNEQKVEDSTLKALAALDTRLQTVKIVSL